MKNQYFILPVIKARPVSKQTIHWSYPSFVCVCVCV